MLVRDVNADLAHDFHRERIQSFRLNPGAEGFKIVACQITQEALCHLASGRVACTQEQNFGFNHETVRPPALLHSLWGVCELREQTSRSSNRAATKKFRAPVRETRTLTTAIPAKA